VQDLASKVGGGEQQRSCSPETSLQLQRYEILENQQMHQNDHFIVMSSQTLLHVSAYQRHNQGVHKIFTGYLYVGVHYRRNNGISSEVASISSVTLWI
jgi:hypothetical protein